MASFVAAAQGGDGQTATVTSLTLTIPSGLATGDRFVVFIDSSDSAMALGTVTSGGTGSWNVLDSPRANGTNAATAVLDKVLTSGDPGSTLTVPFTSSAARADMFGLGFTGVGSGAAVLATPVQDTSAVSSYSLPTKTGVTAGSVQIGAYLRRRSGTAGTITVPSPYTTPSSPGGSPATAYSSAVNVFAASGYVASSASGTVGGETATSGTSSIGTNYLVILPVSSAFSGSGALTGSGTLAAGTGTPAISQAAALTGSGGLSASSTAPVVTLTFDGGTNGSTLAAGGDVAAVAGTSTYSTAAAKHGALGLTTTSGTSTQPTFTVSRTTSFTDPNQSSAVSVYVQPVSIGGGAVQLINFQNSASAIIGTIRLHSDGHFDLATAARVVASTMSWSTGTWYRLDIVYNGSTQGFTISVFAGSNVEGTTADETFSGTGASQSGGLDHWLCSPGRSSTAGCQVYLDTVRFYDGTVTPVPFGASGSGALSGSGSLSATGTPAPSQTATLAGSGDLTAIPPGITSLSGSGGLAGAGTPAPSQTKALSGSGSLSAAAGIAAGVTLTFDGGTDGTSLATGGAISTVNGTMTYSSAAAKHGAEGLSGTAVSASNPDFIVPWTTPFADANRSNTVSVYVQPTALSSGSITWLALLTSANTNLVTVRCNANTGVFDLYAGSILAASSLSYTIGTWYRLDLTYNGATSAVTLTIFAGSNVEGTTPDSTVTATAVAGTMDHWTFSPCRGGSTTSSGYLDTVRIYDGVLTPPPYASPAQGGAGSLSGAGSLVAPDGTATASQTAATSATGVLNSGLLVFTGSAALSGSGVLAATGNDMVVFTFDGGTDGTALAAGGGISSVSSPPPTYAAVAAKHGGLGITGTGNTGGPLFSVPRPAGFSNANASATYSIYAKPITVPGGALRVLSLRNAANTQLAVVRFNSTGNKIDIANTAGSQVVATSLAWVASTWYRLDVTVDCGSNAVTLNVFAGANCEGTVPDATIAWNSTTITGLASANISVGSASTAGAQAYIDTVRIYDGVVTPAPYGPGNTAALTGTGNLAAAGGTGKPPAQLTGSGVLTVAGAEQVIHTWVGAPSTTGFTVKARTTGFAAPSMLVSPNSNMSAATSFTASAPDSAGYVTAVASGLSAGTRYYYQFADTVASVTTSYGPISKARTLPTVSGGQSFRVAFGSCVTTNATDASALNDVVTWDPDLFIHLGDFDYAGDTSTDPAHQRGTYENQILGTTGLSNLMANVPWAYATSDHEAGPDNGDSNNLYTAANITAYSEIVPTYPLADTRSPVVGRYQTWVIGRVRFILLDIRNTDRSPGLSTDDATKTMLGATQKAWLKARLLDPEPVKVILSDVGWMGPASTANGEDKWWSYSTERQEISDFITANGVKVLLWHGDSHALAVATPAANTWGGFPVYCSSPLRNTGGGRNLTTFSSYYTNSGGNCAQYARVTITDNGSNITFAYSGYDALNSVVRVTQTDVIPTPAIPALSGSGSLGAGGTPRPTVGASLSGSGGLGATSALTALGSGSLSGSGALSSAPATVSAGASTTLSGAGTLATSNLAGEGGTGAFAGSGTLVSAGALQIVRSVALSGAGALGGIVSSIGYSASPNPQLSGAGTLTFGGYSFHPDAPVPLSGVGTLTVGVATGQRGAPTLSAAGTLSIAARVTLAGTGALSGSGTLTRVGVANVFGLGALSGSGTLTSGTGQAVVTSAPQLTGLGSLILASAQRGVNGTAAFSGLGILAVVGNYPDGTGRPGETGSGVLTGSGALTSIATELEHGVGTLGGPGALSILATPGPLVGPGLAGSGTLTSALLTMTASTPKALSALGALVALGAPGGPHAVALTGAGVLGVLGVSNIAASAEFVFDPGFERTPSPWATTAYWQLDGTFSRSGSGSIKGNAVVAPQSLSVPMTVTGAVPVTPGQVWMASAWVWTSSDWNGTTNNGKLRLADQTGALINTAAWGGNPGTWSFRSITYTVPGTTPPTGLTLSLVNDATVGTLWVDDVSLHMLSNVGGAAAPTPTLTGSGSLSPALVAVTRSVTRALSGSGTVAVTSVPRPSVGLYYSFAGAGALTSSGVYGFRPTVATSGSGALTTGATPAEKGAPALSGAGALLQTVLAGPRAAAMLTGTGLLSGAGAPNALRAAPFTGTGTLAGTQVGEIVGGKASSTGLGTLAAVDAVALSGRANLTATGQLLSAAGITARGVASTFMVGTLSIPRQSGVILGADHPLWVNPSTAPPSPWVRPASTDLIATHVHDPLRVRRTRAY